MHTHILIDRTGIHYINKLNDKTIHTVEWQDFTSVPKGDYDVYPKTRYLISLTIFVASPSIVWYDKSKGKMARHYETFESRHFWFAGTNTKALTHKFVAGLQRFRPDIRIHPDINT